MNNRLKLLIIMTVACLLISPAVLAEETYTSKGADSCLMCHKAEKWGVMDIFQTKHGSLADPDAPFSNLQCEACHGPSNEHARAKNKSEVKVARTFGEGDTASVPEQNEACLSCHQDHTNMGWFGSRHESVDVGCVSCHSVHEQRDPVFDPLLQQEICFDCHQRVRSDTYKSSGHGLRFGSLACSDCHNVHDGNNDYLLTQDNVNETCYDCHAEKRGPFLWEHAPVGDDCSLCHKPHGSNHPALLTKRPPLLCQQCHSADAHPGDAYTSEEIDDRSKSRFLMSRGCMNCHSQVHGSNHPSGSSQRR
jgi:DmsE family decaheme c-type cytochrome